MKMKDAKTHVQYDFNYVKRKERKQTHLDINSDSITETHFLYSVTTQLKSTYITSIEMWMLVRQRQSVCTDVYGGQGRGGERETNTETKKQRREKRKGQR